MRHRHRRRHHNRRHVVHHRRRHHNRRHYGFRRRRLRNPRHGGSVTLRNVVRAAVVPAAIGGAGALALDVVMGYVNPYLPATLQSGWFSLLTKGAGAVALGLVASKFLGRERGKVVMIGALTVTAYGAIRSAASGMGIPGLAGLGFRDYTPYPMRMGAYIAGPTGTRGIQGLSYVSPGAVVAPTLSPKLGAYMSGAANVVAPMGDYGDGM